MRTMASLSNWWIETLNSSQLARTPSWITRRSTVRGRDKSEVIRRRLRCINHLVEFDARRFYGIKQKLDFFLVHAAIDLGHFVQRCKDAEFFVTRAFVDECYASVVQLPLPQRSYVVFELKIECVRDLFMFPNFFQRNEFRLVNVAVHTH